MISVEEAESLIIENSPVFASESCKLRESYGRIIQETLRADRPQPPFNRVAMDGIAINTKSFEKGNRQFPIEDVVGAGQKPPRLENPDACFEVMTGCVLPEGCDCVIKVEDLLKDEFTAYLDEIQSVEKMQNVHQFASDFAEGAILVEEGAQMRGVEIAVAASVGADTIQVARYPRIAVLSTGDELVDTHEDVLPWQIRRSNSCSIISVLRRCGFSNVEEFHLPDLKIVIEEKLAEILKDFEMIILSGGVSMGKFDFIPVVLDELGMKKVFHKVKQRPGKPFWFGKNNQGKCVFALPGNPVSTLVCFQRYVLPQLYRCAKQTEKVAEFVVLAEDVCFKKDLTYFLPVKILADSANAQLMAQPIPVGSGNFASLAKTDGFIELDAGTNEFKTGHIARFYRWQ